MSANIRDGRRTASRSPWLETVLVMKTAENRIGDDAVALANPMVAQHGRDVRAVGNTRSQARVWTPAIVVSDPLPKHTSHVALIQRNHEIQTLTADRADQAFAECVRLRRPHRLLRTVSPIAAIVRSTPSE